MDKELLAAIGEMLDKKLDEKLDLKLEPINSQIDNISCTVINILNDVHKLSEGQAKLSEGQFQLQSEVRELHKGQERIETRLDHREADVKAIGDMYRDHETQIRELRKKVASP